MATRKLKKIVAREEEVSEKRRKNAKKVEQVERRNLKLYGTMMQRILGIITRCDKKNRKIDWNDVIFTDDLIKRSAGKLATFMKIRRSDGTLFTPTVQQAELFFLTALATRLNKSDRSRFELNLIPTENRVVISRKRYSFGYGSGDAAAAEAAAEFVDIKSELENVAADIHMKQQPCGKIGTGLSDL